MLQTLQDTFYYFSTIILTQRWISCIFLVIFCLRVIEWISPTPSFNEISESASTGVLDGQDDVVNEFSNLKLLHNEKLTCLNPITLGLCPRLSNISASFLMHLTALGFAVSTIYNKWGVKRTYKFLNLVYVWKPQCLPWGRHDLRSLDPSLRQRNQMSHSPTA